MDKKSFVVAFIPAFNEERTIASVILRTQRYVDEVIVCDDGSTDMTAEIAERLGTEVFRNERNLGYGAALATLFGKAREKNADVMITLDSDGQHNPDDIPKFIEPIVNGEADIIVGSRFLDGSTGSIPQYRRIGIATITGLTDNVTHGDVTDSQSGFRAYSKKAIELIRPTEMGMGASVEILMKAHDMGLRVKEVPIEVKYEKGSSTQNPVSHGLEVVLSIVKFMSIRHPLLFYAVPGLLAMFVGFFFWIWTLQLFATTRQVVTNITLIAIGASIVGLMLLTTGVMLWVLVSIVREAARGQR